MKKEYNIVGLDCGHCALTLEKYLQKVQGVKDCVVNFSTSKVFLDINDSESKKTLKKVFETTKQVNPSVKITEVVENDKNAYLIDILLLAIGIILGICAIFLNLYNWLSWGLLICAVVLIGYKTYWKAIVQIRHLKINENTLITLSVIGAIAIGEKMEGLMVIGLYTIGKLLESKAVKYSRKSISSLISNQPEFAVVVDGENENKVKPEMVKVGDIIVVKPGEKIALDGEVVWGSASVDKSHITGESIPTVVGIGDKVLSGSIVLNSSIKIKVDSEYKDSAVSKILNLVSNASSKKSKTESVIAKIASWYTLAVMIASVLVFGIVWLVTKEIKTAIFRGLIFLVVSCPCAFAISVPLTYFSGIGRCSKHGILVKGSNFLERCASVNKVVFDKTGTLTSGKFEVVKVEPIGKISSSELMDIVVAGENNSTHPIAVAICNFHTKKSKIKVTKFNEIAGEGIEFEVSKSKYFVGKIHTESAQTIVVVKKDGVDIGKIYLKDKIKINSKDAINQLKSLEIKPIMLTGDNFGVAKDVASEINIEEFKSGLLPSDKFEIIENYKSNGDKVAFVGDGLNDAPALTMADVGISMGILGSPATIEASDVVIADDNINQIPKLVKISKKTKRIAFGNIIFAGLTKLTFLMLGAFGITGMAFAVFADVGVTLLAILNSLRVLVFKLK